VKTRTEGSNPSPSARQITLLRIITKASLLLLFTASIHASCLDNDDPAYNLAISQGNYEHALDLVSRELHLSPDQRRHFKIIQGFGVKNDDRNGQADPDTLDLKLDPELFNEGKEGACQGVAHEVEHLKQFQKDRRTLHNFYAQHAPADNGWNKCDQENFGTHDPEKAEEDAYSCLEDNDIITHAASDDIEAVLAQVPYATERKLRDDDMNYLLDNLKAWVDNVALIQDQSNISYYLPEIKRRDTRVLCRGVHYIQERRLDSSPFYQVWQMYCRINPGY
jgi:hypothetical protein